MAEQMMQGKASEMAAKQTIPAGYKQTEVGVIPMDWEVMLVGDSFIVCNNLRLPISSKIRDGMSGSYPYYGPTKIQSYINEYRVEGEYALIGEDGDHFLKFDSVNQTQLVCGKFNVNNHAHLIKGNIGSAKWFYWFFINRDISIYLTRQGAGRFKLNKASLERIQCAIPPMEEQLAITTVLSDSDALIVSLEQLIAKKQAIKTATMQQLLTGKSRLLGFSDGWCRQELKNLVSSPITDGPHTTPAFRMDGVPFLSVNNLVNNRINLSELRFISKEDDDVFAKKCKPQIGDVLLGKAASVGKVAIVDTDFDFNIWSPIALIRPNGLINPQFLYYQLLSADAIAQITLLTNSSSQGNIGMGDIEKIQISFPCIEEQSAIATILSDMDSELTALEQKLAKARDVKQGMMQQLLTGRIRLPLSKEA